MTTHRTGTRKEWLAARLEPVDAEKALTHAGRASLAELFQGRSQLFVYHFMFASRAPLDNR